MNNQRYTAIENSLFKLNRQNLVAHLGPNSLAVLDSNDVMPTNADGTMPFKQNNDLFYLCGIDQEDTILVLFPEAQNTNHKEVLFIRETNDHIAIWEGNMLSKVEAREVSGIQTIYWTSQFDQIFYSLAVEAEGFYLNTNEHLRADNLVGTRNDRLISRCKTKFPLHSYNRLAPILQELRTIKSDIEIALMRKACAITEAGFRRALQVVKPGVMEYEIEAELTHEFIRQRSRGHAYPPIIASGTNTCVLHYIKNNKCCKDGDLLLLDVGAEYANYAADLTRTIPVGGKFSARQKAVYSSVLRILKGATHLLVPGNTFEVYNTEVIKMVEEELVQLNLFTEEDLKNQDRENPLYKKYFMHGISHFLGLDVHDVGSKNKPFAAGMVLTCEPGIYIREEGFGIRLENNILITPNGPENLMKNIPLEIEEIESLMGE